MNETVIPAATRPIASIRIGARHRKELGDIASLARSIEDVGLLHPIVIQSDGKLIAGARRLAACKQLGWRKIPVTVLNLEHLVFGEQAENIDRKDFTVEERVAIGLEIERLLGERERRGRPSKENTQNFGEYRGKETAQVAAEKAGFRNAETYRQAKEVVAKAEAEPTNTTPRRNGGRLRQSGMATGLPKRKT